MKLASAVIANYVLACVGSLGTIMVLICLLRFSSFKTCYTNFLLFLNISLLMQQILTLPHIYKGNDQLCRAVQAFYFYFALMNICTVGITVFVSFSALLNGQLEIRLRVIRFGRLLLLLFPMITFLPFTTNEYQVPEHPWCVEPFDTDELFSLFIFYVWVWMIDVGCIVSLIYMVYVLVKQDDVTILKKFFSTIGLFTIVSVICWFARTFQRVHMNTGFKDSSDGAIFASFLTIYLSAIIYTLIFFVSEKKSVELFELQFASRSSIVSAKTFTWEADELKALIETSSNPNASQRHTYASNSQPKSSWWRNTLSNQSNNSIRSSTSLNNDSYVGNPLSSHKLSEMGELRKSEMF